MNKLIKTVLLIVGVVLIGYGIYMLVQPEASISIGEFSVEAQDNTNAYMTIAFGLVSAALGLLGRKR